MSCTDRPCAWGQGSVTRDPGRIKDKAYGDDNHVRRAYFDPRPTKAQKKTEEELLQCRHRFLQNVQRLYVTEYIDTDRQILFDLHLDYYYPPFEETKENLLKVFPLCRLFLGNLKEASHCGPYQVPDTISQSESKVWLGLHAVLITASVVKRAYHMKPEGFKNFLRQHLWQMNAFKGNAATRYGLNNEKNARKKYEEDEKKDDPTITVKPTGLWRNPKFMEFGCSPDGIVLPKKDGIPKSWLLEIKCPPTIKACHPELFEAKLTKAQQGTFCLHRGSDNKIHLKEDHQYYYQVQFSMGILQMSRCAFLVWSPKGTFKETVKFDRKFFCELIDYLRPLHHKLIIPEYFLQRTWRNMEPCQLKF